LTYPTQPGQLSLLDEAATEERTEPDDRRKTREKRCIRKEDLLKQARWENNRKALALIEKGNFNREEIFRLYTGLGGLHDAEEGESFLASSHKALGQYFTPEPVAKFIADLLAVPAGAWVLDNCCGHGAMFWHLPQGCQVAGIELQEEAYRIAKALYSEGRIIRDSCLNHLFDGDFDYALINPPFGLHWRTELNLDLANHAGSILSQVACLELTVRAVKPSGYVAAILPKGAFERPDLVTFRRWYRNHARVAAQISLPETTFVKVGASAATEILLLQKLPAPEFPPFTYDVLSVGWDEEGNPEPSDLGYALVRWRRTLWHDGAKLYATQIAGMFIGAIGAALAIWCVLAFALVGRGTPAPFDPPRKLVVRGPYKYVRNPMYLGAALALAGAALFYQSVSLWIYTAAFLILMHLFVILYEEPTLRRSFGEEYESYCKQVRRWLPKLKEN